MDYLKLFPKYQEQKQIAYRITLIESKLTIIQQKKEQLQELFKTLLHQLMTAKIRVDELDLTVLEEII